MIFTLSINQEGQPSDCSSWFKSIYYLSDNYPNPFNPTTTLRYQVPEAVEISFTIYDLRGMVVKQVNRNHNPGYYTFKRNGHNDSGETMASGTYFIRMSTPGYSVTKKLLLLKKSRYSCKNGKRQLPVFNFLLGRLPTSIKITRLSTFGHHCWCNNHFAYIFQLWQIEHQVHHEFFHYRPQ